MVRRGFTLAELTITIGLVILVLAVMLPSLQKARAAARMAACASNQHQISLLFPILRTEDIQAGLTVPTSPHLPKESWPSRMLTMVNDQSIFICAEDVSPAEANARNRIVYINEHTSTQLTADQSLWYTVKYFPGDPGYFEFVVEDDKPGSFLTWGHDSNDGRFRIYDDGWLEPIGGTCNQANNLYLDGVDLFPTGKTGQNGIVGNKGKKIFVGGNGKASYGLNIQASKVQDERGRFVILSDFAEQLWIDPNVAQYATTRQRLQKSARHMGKLNALLHDGSIDSYSAGQLDPQLFPDRWMP